MTDQTAYLNLVLEKLNERIAKLNLSLAEGAKEVEDMHEYYRENYTERWVSTDMRIMIISRPC